MIVKDKLPLRVSVVIAAYDEIETIIPLTLRLDVALKSIPDCSRELIFVVEGRDGTREALPDLSAQVLGIHLLYREVPSGLGDAFRRGFGVVAENAQVVVTLDADLNHQPEEIPRLVAALHDADADVVVGSRFVAGSRVDGSPLWKRALSGVANRVMRWLYGLRVFDATSGFRIYRAAVVREVSYSSNTFSFLPELLIRINAAGYRIIEEPIHFIFRHQGASKLSFWMTVWSYVRLFAARLARRRPSSSSVSPKVGGGRSAKG